jgi:hypothetical protein
MENKKELTLKHFALFAKGWYDNTGDERKPENVWDSAKKALAGDNYMPETKNDVIGILTARVTPLSHMSTTDHVMDMLSIVDPTECWKHGYVTKDYPFASDAERAIFPAYDYKTAVLYYYIHCVRFMNNVSTGQLPPPDPKVMPTKKMTKENKAMFGMIPAAKMTKKQKMLSQTKIKI